MMPYDMLNESSIHGVELDTITGGIAQILYPSAKVEISGFEEANAPDNFYDRSIVVSQSCSAFISPRPL